MIDKSRKPAVLIVEDDIDLAEALTTTLERNGYRVHVASEGGEALHKLAQAPVQLVLSDVRMQPLDGYALLARLRDQYPNLPVILMTAHGTIGEAVDALRGGARDYLPKPFEAETLLSKIRRHALPINRFEMIAESPRMRQVRDMALRAAQTDVTVMITGESGAGKEVMARFIHTHSQRAPNPFVAINCAAIPDTLLEATLMGYEKGAFTGALKASPGKFEQAQGGTLLLDEVTEMSANLQAKLLRVLQERELERVGGHTRIPLNVRVLATSNRNLGEAVQGGQLREDLFYRLNVFPLALPSLAERQEDIVPLAQTALARWRATYGEGPDSISENAMRRLQNYSWPGNVRELENVIQRAVILSPGRQIGGDAILLDTSLDPTPTGNGLTDDLREHERERIASALQETGGVRGEAARKLGISPRTLRHKLKQYRDAGIPIPGCS